jgi:hypothetical protein
MRTLRGLDQARRRARRYDPSLPAGRGIASIDVFAVGRRERAWHVGMWAGRNGAVGTGWSRHVLNLSSAPIKMIRYLFTIGARSFSSSTAAFVPGVGG